MRELFGGEISTDSDEVTDPDPVIYQTANVSRKRKSKKERREQKQQECQFRASANLLLRVPSIKTEQE